MKKLMLILDNLIKCFVYGALLCTFVIVGIALFGDFGKGEANIGSFQTETFNEGWLLEYNDTSSDISLPFVCDASVGDVITIKNTLPEDLTDNSSIMTRSTLEDMYVYVNGELREHYASEDSKLLPYFLPSVYMVTSLTSDDAGAEIEIKYNVKSRGVINEIGLGHGNNTWFAILKKNISADITTFVVFVLGFLLIVIAAIMQRFVSEYRPPYYLGLLMVDIAIWMFSESSMKQLLLQKPSLSSIFTYISFELLGVLTCLFFDAVQNRRYHKIYQTIEAIVCIQLMVNTILHITHVLEYHQTLISSHIWLIVELAFVLRNVAIDIHSKRIHEYRTTAIGMIGFLIFSVTELVVYYLSDVPVFGRFVSVGLVILTIATVIQVFVSQIRVSREHTNEQKKMLINLIETVAGAIDAKDEYTGGHSERVGHYATVLARAMAKDYDFSEEDILRIHYIGNMHDIGKIGVADSILNKAGKLTGDEFTLMKKHVDIGAELVIGMEGSIAGLLDGILYHHERYDGKGYPSGLSGEDIPLVARIICLADCYDAMTSNRVYRKRLSSEEVRAEIVRCKGSQFDPELAEIFIKLMDKGEMVPQTVDGMTISKTGEVTKAAQLEKYLQITSESEESKSKNPSYIRMLSYFIKLKENNGEQVNIFILSLKDKSFDVKKIIASIIKSEDISICFNDNQYIITLFGRTDEQIKEFMSICKEHESKAHIEQLFA